MNSFQIPGFSKGAFTLCQDETSATPEKVQARAKRPNLPWTWRIHQRNCGDFSAKGLLRFQYAGAVKTHSAEALVYRTPLQYMVMLSLLQTFSLWLLVKSWNCRPKVAGYRVMYRPIQVRKKNVAERNTKNHGSLLRTAPCIKGFWMPTIFKMSSSWPTNSKWKHLLRPGYARLVARLFVLIHPKLKKLLKDRSCLKRFTKLAHH